LSNIDRKIVERATPRWLSLFITAFNVWKGAVKNPEREREGGRE
jgi:hypothetical protein